MQIVEQGNSISFSVLFRNEMMTCEQECSFKRKYTEEGTIQKENKCRVAWCQKSTS